MTGYEIFGLCAVGVAFIMGAMVAASIDSLNRAKKKHRQSAGDLRRAKATMEGK